MAAFRRLLSGQPKQEVWGEPARIALHLLIQPFGRYSVNKGKVGIENGFLPTHLHDERVDLGQDSLRSGLFHVKDQKMPEERSLFNSTIAELNRL